MSLGGRIGSLDSAIQHLSVIDLDASGDVTIGGTLDVTGDVTERADENLLGDLIMGTATAVGGDIKNYQDNAGTVGLLYTASTGQLQLAITGSGAGLKLGTDVVLFRGAADRLELDDILRMTGDRQIQFRDSAITIRSASDGHLDLDADTSIDMNAIVNLTSYTYASNDLIFNVDAKSISAPATDDNYTMFNARDSGVGYVEIARMQGAADPYFSLGSGQEFKFYSSGYFRVLTDKKIEFRDTDIHIQSKYDSQLWLTADATIELNANNIQMPSKLTHTGDADTYIDYSPDNIDLIAGGTTNFSMTATGPVLPAGQELLISGTTAKIRFEDATGASIYAIYADYLRITGGTLLLSPATIIMTAYLVHEGDLDTSMHYTTDNISFNAGGTNNIDFTATGPIVPAGVALTILGADANSLVLGTATAEGGDIIVYSDGAGTESFNFDADTGRLTLAVSGTNAGIELGPYAGAKIYQYGAGALLSISPGLRMQRNEYITFGDSNVSIRSGTDGHLDLSADVQIDLESTRVVLGAGLFVPSGGTITNESSGGSFVINAYDTGFGIVPVAKVQGAADPYMAFGGSEEFKFYYSGYMELSTTAKLQFRDANTYINSASASVLDIYAATSIYLYSNMVTLQQYLAHSGDPDTYIRFQADQLTLQTGGVDVFDIYPTYALVPLTVQLQFGDSAVHVASANDGRLDLTADTAIDLNSPLTVIWNNDKLVFRDAQIFIHSSQDGQLDIACDGPIGIASDAVYIGDYLYHTGDADTYMRYTTNRIRMVAGANVLVDMNNTAVGFFGAAGQAQQAHIVDADGTLGDITSKFNTLLADLEGYGLLASA